MSTLANNPMTLHAIAHDAAPLIGRRLIVAWPCTRRMATVQRGRLLERVNCVIAVQPLDQQHATIECWIESAGARQRTVLHSSTRACAIDADAEFTHLDMAAADGTRLLALTVDRTGQRVAYAQTTLLHDAGLLGGTYDPPTMRASADERVAQSA